jgi:hypothetical protein
VLVVRHFAHAGKVELGKVGRDGAVKVGFDPENAGENFVELALISVSLVDNVKHGARRAWRQACGSVPASSARINDVQRVHLEASSPKNAILKGSEL